MLGISFDILTCPEKKKKIKKVQKAQTKTKEQPKKKEISAVKMNSRRVLWSMSLLNINVSILRTEIVI